MRARVGLGFGRPGWLVVAGLLVCAGGCRQPAALTAQGVALDDAGPMLDHLGRTPTGVRNVSLGFDRNDYPGDARLPELRRHFSFAGFWLNAPPGETASSWTGHRKALRDAGFGFLVLWNGRLEREIKVAGVAPDALGRQDAAAAVSAARREGFPSGTTLFLDQEEGGRLTDTQAAYFFGWTEAVAAGGFTPGAYLSGQSVPDGTGPDGRPATITTAQAVREQVASRHAHPVALWVYDDTCPPAPGCVVSPAPALGSSGTGDAIAWQYAQSPRRPANTASCRATYAADNLCYAGVSDDLYLDLDVAASADPSHGR